MNTDLGLRLRGLTMRGLLVGIVVACALSGVAQEPHAARPKFDAFEVARLEQMQMLRALLVERFALKFHRQDKEMSIYALTVAKSGPKLKAAAKPDDPAKIVGVVYPDRIDVAARSVTMDDFVAMLQRATLDKP